VAFLRSEIGKRSPVFIRGCVKSRDFCRIGCDGSACAEAALADLKRAGLPRKAEVVALSVAEEMA